jgi:hypothetical protein
MRYIGLDGKQKIESPHSKKFSDAQLLFADRQQAIGKGEEPEVKKISKHIDFIGRRCWFRTSDLFRVKEALYP